MSESKDQGRLDVWFVTGASGFLGHALCAALLRAGRRVTGQVLSHSCDVPGVKISRVDVARADDLTKAVRAASPDVVVHCAALTDVDECERVPDKAMQINARSCGTLSDLCGRIGARFVLISTDQLWGHADPRISEKLPPSPLNVYGRTKAEGERLALRSATSLVLRTNIIGQGRFWRPTLIDQILTRLHTSKSFPGFTDVFFTPLDVRLLSELIIECVDLGLDGIYHLAGAERVSKFEFAVRTAQRFGFDAGLVREALVANVGLRARRPKEMSLDCRRVQLKLGCKLPDIGRSLDSIWEQNRP